VIRDKTKYDVELAVRLPELQIKGLSNKSLNHLAPLSEWWHKFITPKINKLVMGHIEQCKKWIKSGEIYNDPNKYCIIERPLHQL